MRAHYVFVYISKWASWHKKNLYQCQLQVMTTMSASEGFALVDDRKKHHPVQIAEGQDHHGH